jgi:hypothetical protein
MIATRGLSISSTLVLVVVVVVVHAVIRARSACRTLSVGILMRMGF